MRVQTVKLVGFKRFDDLTIDLGPNPKKIVAMVGPNGCGKSSVFDGFVRQIQSGSSAENEDFYSKSRFYDDNPQNEQYKTQKVNVTFAQENIYAKGLYFRTSYRYTPKINVNQIRSIQKTSTHNDNPISTIALDQRLHNNYERLHGVLYSEYTRGKKTGDQIHGEFIEKVNTILDHILDIQISNLGEPLNQRGQIYFKKDNTIDFPYANLSSGEKEVVDMVIDLLIKSEQYTETLYCIDEPELHLSTAIQRQLLVEINKLIPDNCQLWVATHSIGFIRALQNELKEDCQILDFSEKDYFTGTQTIEPIVPNRKNWMRIFETALDDLTDLVAPKRIIYCEGKAESGPNRIEKGLDAQIYENIFSAAFPDTVFVSSGGNTEPDQRSDIAIDILGKVLKGIEIWVLKDRDIGSGKSINEPERKIYLDNNLTHHRVLKRWELENYLFDKEILLAYCNSAGLSFDEKAYDNFVTDIDNDNVKDEVNCIKNFCGIQTNIGVDKFKLNLSKHIKKETEVYKELRECIFDRK